MAGNAQRLVKATEQLGISTPLYFAANRKGVKQVPVFSLGIVLKYPLPGIFPGGKGPKQ